MLSLTRRENPTHVLYMYENVLEVKINFGLKIMIKMITLPEPWEGEGWGVGKLKDRLEYTHRIRQIYIWIYPNKRSTDRGINIIMISMKYL